MFVEPRGAETVSGFVSPNSMNWLLILSSLYFSPGPPPRERLLFKLLPGTLLSARTASLGEQLLKVMPSCAAALCGPARPVPSNHARALEASNEAPLTGPAAAP